VQEGAGRLRCAGAAGGWCSCLVPLARRVQQWCGRHPVVQMSPSVQGFQGCATQHCLSLASSVGEANCCVATHSRRCAALRATHLSELAHMLFVADFVRPQPVLPVQAETHCVWEQQGQAVVGLTEWQESMHPGSRTATAQLPECRKRPVTNSRKQTCRQPATAYWVSNKDTDNRHSLRESSRSNGVLDDAAVPAAVGWDACWAVPLLLRCEGEPGILQLYRCPAASVMSMCRSMPAACGSSDGWWSAVQRAGHRATGVTRSGDVGQRAAA
jgi:hypothetical protein